MNETNTDEVPYCLGMMMDTRITQMESVRIDYKTLDLFRNLLADILSDIELMVEEEVGEYDILMYLKVSSLFGLFNNIERKQKNIQPNAPVHFKIRIDDALFIVMCLSMQEDNKYASELRILRSLCNTIIAKNKLTAKFAIEVKIETVKTVSQSIEIPNISEVFANNLPA